MAVQESGDHVTFLRKLIPGAASTSYGIYCARLAGLPDSIIDRAYVLLEHLEADAENLLQVSSDKKQPAYKVAEAQTVPSYITASEPELAIKETAAAVQLSIFDEPGVPAVHQQEQGRRKASPKAEQLADQLRKLDLFNMTPMQAMQWLNEMKQKIND
jgi:DNA mismatch repair protein MutS